MFIRRHGILARSFPMVAHEAPGDGGGAGGGGGDGKPPEGDGKKPEGDGKPPEDGKKEDEGKLSNAEAAELRKLRKEREAWEAEKKKREDAELSEMEKRDRRIKELEEGSLRKDRMLIGAEFGLPRDIWDRIQGGSEEEMRADAEKLKALFPAEGKKEEPKPGSTGTGDKKPDPKPPGNPEIEKLENELNEAKKAGQSLKVIELGDKLRVLKAAQKK